MTQVYGLFGRPVGHSPSPRLHNAWFTAAGLDCTYAPFEIVPRYDADVLDAIRKLGFAGGNLTVPLKTAIVDALDGLEGDAQRARAVNVLTREGDRWIGGNTDGDGLMQALLADGIDPAGREVVILGNGGTARAVAVAVARRGAGTITLLGRDPARASAAAGQVSGPQRTVRSGPLTSDRLAGADLIVVCTSGHAAAVAALDPSLAAPGACWVDVNYWDDAPPAWAAARAAGCRTVTGHAMLVHQAAQCFARWTGIQPDLAVGHRLVAGRS